MYSYLKIILAIIAPFLVSEWTIYSAFNFYSGVVELGVIIFFCFYAVRRYEKHHNKEVIT